MHTGLERVQQSKDSFIQQDLKAYMQWIAAALLPFENYPTTGGHRTGKGCDLSMCIVRKFDVQ